MKFQLLAFVALTSQIRDVLDNVCIILRRIKHGYETSCNQVFRPGD
jgi:hypothetical protein